MSWFQGEFFVDAIVGIAVGCHISPCRLLALNVLAVGAHRPYIREIDENNILIFKFPSHYSESLASHYACNVFLIHTRNTANGRVQFPLSCWSFLARETIFGWTFTFDLTFYVGFMWCFYHWLSLNGLGLLVAWLFCSRTIRTSISFFRLLARRSHGWKLGHICA